MSRNYVFHAGGAPCLRKRSFATEEQATARLRVYHGTGLAAKRAYQCPWCEQWHLTSATEKAT